MAISRRGFLKVSGGAIASVLTGCVTTGEIAEKPSTLPKIPGGNADLSFATFATFLFIKGGLLGLFGMI